MNREEYFNELRQRNGDCNCLPLAVLYSKREDTNYLERECEALSKGLDIDHPRLNDKPRLRKFKEKAEQFQSAVRDYNLKITELIEEGDLNVFSHNPKDKSTRQIFARSLQRFSEVELITVNCSSCNQQVDILNLCD